MRTMLSPPLLLCLAVSLVLHVMCLALTGFWIFPTAGRFNQLFADYQIHAKLVPLSESSSPPLAVVSEEKPEESVRVTPSTGEATESSPIGLQGYQERTSVIPFSVDDYLPPSRLDRLPKLIGSVDASVDFKGMTGVVGDAEIVLLISSKGDVDDIVIIQSTLPGFLVDKAVSNFKKAKYEPGVLGSMAVRSRLRIHLQPPTDDELLGNPSSARERAWR